MLTVRETRIEVVRGSVLDQDVEAIVNAANVMMRGGGGVDGAIHAAAGRELLDELRRLAPRGCHPGEVILTGGHALKQKHILHTPGPIWFGGFRHEPVVLAKCYRNCLIKASEHGLESIAFCSISTGAYRFPIEKASRIAVSTVAEWLHDQQTPLRRLVFAMRQEEEHRCFTQALHEFTTRQPRQPTERP